MDKYAYEYEIIFPFFNLRKSFCQVLAQSYGKKQPQRIMKAVERLSLRVNILRRLKPVNVIKSNKSKSSNKPYREEQLVASPGFELQNIKPNSKFTLLPCFKAHIRYAVLFSEVCQ